MCWGELILSGLVWQANALLPICCGWEDVHGVNGLSTNVHSKDIPWGKHQQDGCSFVVCTDLLFQIIFEMIYSAMKHHVVCLDTGVYKPSWKYETALDMKLWINGL